MTLTLSQGPWLVAASPGDLRPGHQTHYSLNATAAVDATYRWDFKGQALASMTPCSFSFSGPEQCYNPGLHMPVVWNTSTCQRSWETMATPGKEDAPVPLLASENNAPKDTSPSFLAIELTARYFWQSDLSEADCSV